MVRAKQESDVKQVNAKIVSRLYKCIQLSLIHRVVAFAFLERLPEPLHALLFDIIAALLENCSNCYCTRVCFKNERFARVWKSCDRDFERHLFQFFKV